VRGERACSQAGTRRQKRRSREAYLIRQLIYVDIRASLASWATRRTGRNKAFIVNIGIALLFTSDFFGVRARYFVSVGPPVFLFDDPGPRPRSEHGVLAAGRQCISAHYPKITIIL